MPVVAITQVTDATRHEGDPPHARSDSLLWLQKEFNERPPSHEESQQEETGVDLLALARGGDDTNCQICDKTQAAQAR